MSPPLSIGSAPLAPETIETLKLEIAKPRMNADKLRKRLVPPVSGATFWRALHGQRVSKPVQDACLAMARSIQADPHNPIVFKPSPLDPEAVEFERAHTYDWDPDPEAA